MRPKIIAQTPNRPAQAPSLAKSLPPSVLARSYPRGMHIALHTHPVAQLLFSSQGIMQVTTPKGRWFVPPARAVWIPPRITHTVDALADIEMRALLIPSERLALHPEAARLGREFVVAVGPLLREAILGSFDPLAPTRLLELLADVALFQLAEAEDAGTFMPLPLDPRARRVADLVLADPANQRDLTELALAAGTSARTVTRLFPAETDLTFKEWRQRARIMAALELLGSGTIPMKQVAAKLGFSSVSALGHAFRQVTGARPGAFLLGTKEPHRSEQPKVSSDQ